MKTTAIKGSTGAAIGIFEGYQIPKSGTVVYAAITGTSINRKTTKSLFKALINSLKNVILQCSLGT